MSEDLSSAMNALAALSGVCTLLIMACTAHLLYCSCSATHSVIQRLEGTHGVVSCELMQIRKMLEDVQREKDDMKKRLNAVDTVAAYFLRTKSLEMKKTKTSTSVGVQTSTPKDLSATRTPPVRKRCMPSKEKSVQTTKGINNEKFIPQHPNPRCNARDPNSVKIVEKPCSYYQKDEYVRLKQQNLERYQLWLRHVRKRGENVQPCYLCGRYVLLDHVCAHAMSSHSPKFKVWLEDKEAFLEAGIVELRRLRLQGVGGGEMVCQQHRQEPNALTPLDGGTLEGLRSCLSRRSATSILEEDPGSSPEACTLLRQKDFMHAPACSCPSFMCPCSSAFTSQLQ